MTRGWLPLVLVLALLAGCTKEQPQPVELQVGQHRVSVVLPDGWEHVDYGDRHQLRQGFARIMIEELRSPHGELDLAVVDALKRLKEWERRDEASRRRLAVGGHEAVVVDTWDRLSHQFRKRFLFVKIDYALLTAYTMQGEFAVMESALDALVASFALSDSVGQAGPDAGERQAE